MPLAALRPTGVRVFPLKGAKVLRLPRRSAPVLPWTTSPVEGQINRIKMIKRTMYDRAGFDLLRARVLHAA